MRKSGSKPRTLRIEQDRGLAPGDVLKVERRYVVDGIVTCVTDKGKYGGIENVGSVEHIVVEGKEGTRMIPLASVSEIEVVERAKKVQGTSPSFDPAYL